LFIGYQRASKYVCRKVHILLQPNAKGISKFQRRLISSLSPEDLSDRLRDVISEVKGEGRVGLGSRAELFDLTAF
jgi:hypothetical protein